MQKIIIPSSFYKIYRRQLMLPEEIENKKDFKSPFSDANHKYVLNLTDTKKEYLANVGCWGSFFEKLAIAGDLEINCQNVKNISFSMSTGRTGSIIYPKSITINGSEKVDFNMNSVLNQSTKEIYIKADKINASISNCKNLEKIVIDCELENEKQSPWYYSRDRIHLSNLPKLKVLDLTKIKNFNSVSCLDGINPNCIIKLNPEMSITYYTPTSYNHELKRLFGLNLSQGINKKLSIQKILNIEEYDTEKPIEITYKDFVKNVMNIANQDIKNDIIKHKEQEKELLQLLEPKSISKTNQEQNKELIRR